MNKKFLSLILIPYLHCLSADWPNWLGPTQDGVSSEQDWKNKLIKKRGGLAKILPSSRASKIGNIGRQIQKLHEGLNMDITARYLHWASFMDHKLLDKLSNANYHSTELIKGTASSDPFNDFLFHDFNLVLENDMLRKVDTMSMSKSLEVRTPFLDHELVEYVFSLPSSYKIDQKNRKKILKETFYNELPKEVFSRKKHGFEIRTAWLITGQRF